MKERGEVAVENAAILRVHRHFDSEFVDGSDTIARRR